MMPMTGSSEDSVKLAVLLPITSRTSYASPDVKPLATLAAITAGLRNLAASLSSSNTTTILLGIDSDDWLLLQHQQQLADAVNPPAAAAAAAGSAAADVHVLTFSEEDRAGYGPGAVCRLWGIMAEAAVQKYGCDLAVLLGGPLDICAPELSQLVLKTGRAPTVSRYNARRHQCCTAAGAGCLCLQNQTCFGSDAVPRVMSFMTSVS
jgi:hypothetical protein